MATIKYSKQREAIRSYLTQTKSHPTAEVVYEEIKKIYPNISLGTVYRNLNFLVEQGDAIKLSCEDHKEHYDGVTHPHSHFYCKCCHQVYDVNFPIPDFQHLSDTCDFKGQIENCTMIFTGICPNCCNNSSQ